MSEVPSFTLGGGRWYDNESFDCEACCCGELECYTGPCVCFSQGSGVFTCLLAGLLFLPNLFIGAIMGLYNWIMCDACLSDNMEIIEFQENIRKWPIPCGGKCIEKGEINIIKCCGGNVRCKSGPCICISNGTAPLACICSLLCLPFVIILGLINGVINWLTCGALTTDLEKSPIGGLLHI